MNIRKCIAAWVCVWVSARRRWRRRQNTMQQIASGYFLLNEIRIIEKRQTHYPLVSPANRLNISADCVWVCAQARVSECVMAFIGRRWFGIVRITSSHHTRTVLHSIRRFIIFAFGKQTNVSGTCTTFVFRPWWMCVCAGCVYGQIVEGCSGCGVPYAFDLIMPIHLVLAHSSTVLPHKYRTRTTMQWKLECCVRVAHRGQRRASASNVNLARLPILRSNGKSHHIIATQSAFFN